MHREVRGPKPALRGAPSVEARRPPARPAAPARRATSSAVPSLSSSRAEKAVALRTTSKRRPPRKARKRRERRLVLEAGHKDARDREALVAERSGQRFDRLEIVGEIDRAIEDDQGARRARPGLEAGAVKAAEGADRSGRRSVRRGADLGGEKGEARRHVLRAALVEIAPDPLDRAALERRGLIEARVAAPVSGQQRQFDAAPARQRRQFVDAVAPIVRAAEHARDHKLGARAHLLEIEVDRERMAQRRERGDPQRRLRLGKGRHRRARAH